MPYSIQKISEITQGKSIHVSDPDTMIRHLVSDSRHLSFPSGALFLAIKGPNHDGHNYLGEVYEKGVRNFLVSEYIPIDNFPDSNIILVESTVIALQKIGAFHRKQFNIDIIGITGSNGKTIVKEWLYQLLNEDFNIVRSPKSYNSQIGVPLSVWQINEEHHLGIFEAGISKTNEMQALAEIIDCKVGILTNIGSAHDEGFENLIQKANEKVKLFKNADVVIYRKGDPIIDEAVKSIALHKHFSWSTDVTDSDLYVNQIEYDGEYTCLTGKYLDRTVEINIPFTDHASIENAIHCWAYMLHIDCAQHTIQERMMSLHRIEMRLDIKKGIHNSTIINDSYSLDLTSLEQALIFLESQSPKSKKTLILSDILQSGLQKELLYQKVAELIAMRGIEKLITIGSEVSIIKNYLPANAHYNSFDKTQDFINQFDFDSFREETILLKGARKFAFEKIAKKLSYQEHQTVLEINLEALEQNLNYYRSKLGPGTKIMVMVKASAYGSGAAEVARLLSFQKVDYLCVAYTDEAVALRRQGIQLPVMILNPEPTTFDLIIKHDLEPEIYSLHQLKAMLEVVGNKKLEIHLKFDTGMHRLGFEEKDLDQLISILTQNDNLKVQSVFSHLSASEDPNEDTFTHQQFEQFNRMAVQLSARLNYQPLRHILNSAGILRFQQYHLDMVRLGIGLYGIDSSRNAQEELATIHTLKARISQIKILKPGDTVGYGRGGKVQQATKSATVSIGYADGLSRAAGNGNFSVMIHGKLAKTLGSICMDMCMVDVTHIPQAKEGDEVIIFGSEHSITNLANAMNSIPYEVFTGLSDRIKRIYYRS